jgi:hypothetical protein
MISKKKARGRKKRGRPKLAESQRQNVGFVIRMRPREIAQLRELAARADVGIGVYARGILRRHLRAAGVD